MCLKEGMLHYYSYNQRPGEKTPLGHLGISEGLILQEILRNSVRQSERDSTGAKDREIRGVTL
jgi:hypothetical protein